MPEDEPRVLDHSRTNQSPPQPRRMNRQTLLMLLAIFLVIVTWVAAMLAAAMTFQMR